MLDEIDDEFRLAGMDQAVASGNTPPIFDWLLTAFSFQGISDQVARSYMEKHGTASWAKMEASLQTSPSCQKLQTYSDYGSCRYDKGSFTCAEPDHIDSCPVPRPKLRNGRLNQTAYSLFLFVRDIAGGDLIGWIDSQLEAATGSSEADLEATRQEALIGPLRGVFGVADKVLTNALSWLLIGARKQRPIWFETGKAMVVIDRLVHHHLVRTGILEKCGIPHRYGPGCYAEGGCAEIIRSAAERIDASSFNPAFPKIFPRFVQHAIWSFCAADGLDLCNGNRIFDSEPCQISYCYLFRICEKKALNLHNFKYLRYS
ncbi:hypothetical protein [Bradyrhizobium sp. 168]|uniref:hypothetical protein n=1 Tax=Bradyrhizobium sp. 168 TaxID=2782639 RepID=UPI001FFA2AAF|nr:hypothetical protein [Bradyrhizobium sp. 168]